MSFETSISFHASTFMDIVSANKAKAEAKAEAERMAHLNKVITEEVRDLTRQVETALASCSSLPCIVRHDYRAETAQAVVAALEKNGFVCKTERGYAVLWHLVIDLPSSSA